MLEVRWFSFNSNCLKYWKSTTNTMTRDTSIHIAVLYPNFHIINRLKKLRHRITDKPFVDTALVGVSWYSGYRLCIDVVIDVHSTRFHSSVLSRPESTRVTRSGWSRSQQQVCSRRHDFESAVRRTPAPGGPAANPRVRDPGSWSDAMHAAERRRRRAVGVNYRSESSGVPTATRPLPRQTRARPHRNVCRCPVGPTSSSSVRLEAQLAGLTRSTMDCVTHVVTYAQCTSVCRQYVRTLVLCMDAAQSISRCWSLGRQLLSTTRHRRRRYSGDVHPPMQNWPSHSSSSSSLVDCRVAPPGGPRTVCQQSDPASMRVYIHQFCGAFDSWP
jgi:hypothetical protein